MKTNLQLATAYVVLFALLASYSVSAQNYDYSTAEELQLMKGFPPPVDKRVDKTNALLTPPYNRWSYLNMRTIYPTAGIKNADKSMMLAKEIDNGISKLMVSKAGEDGFTTDEKVSMETYFKETFTDAFVVVKGDKVVYEKYLNGMHAHHPHQMMSVTKSFAGLFGLMAVENGDLKESDLVTSVIPELKNGGAFDGATFQQVLNMTNTMHFSEDYADPNSEIVEYAKVQGFITKNSGEKLPASIYEYLVTLKKDKDHAHGEIFHYQTPKTDVVNWATNRATGKSFQDNMYEVLWSKLGTDGETYVLLDQNGTLFAGGGLNATPTDLARFAVMMLNEGKVNGRQVVSSTIIQKLADGGSTEAFKNGPASSGVMGGGDWSYRAQWWVRHTPGKASFNAIGVHGQWIYIDVERDIAIIKQSSQPVSSNNYFDGYNISAYDTIIEYLSK